MREHVIKLVLSKCRKILNSSYSLHFQNDTWRHCVIYDSCCDLVLLTTLHRDCKVHVIFLYWARLVVNRHYQCPSWPLLPLQSCMLTLIISLMKGYKKIFDFLFALLFINWNLVQRGMQLVLWKSFEWLSCQVSNCDVDLSSIPSQNSKG